MFKWLKTELKNQRQYEIALALIIGCLIGFVVGGISSEWALVQGARWWEVMTAIGTVGAVMAAVFMSIWQYKERKQLRITKAEIVSFSLMPKLVAITNDMGFGLKSFYKLNNKEEINADQWFSVTLRFIGLMRDLDEESLKNYASLDPLGARLLAEARSYILMYSLREKLETNGRCTASFIRFYHSANGREEILERYRKSMVQIGKNMSSHNVRVQMESPQVI